MAIKIKHSLQALLILAVLAGLALTVVPLYIENKILPDLSAQTGLSVTLKVRKIGFWSTDIEALALTGNIPSITAGSIRIDYSPLALLQGKLDRVAVDGLSIILAKQDGSLYPAGLQKKEQEAQTPSPGHTLPLSIGKLSCRNAIISIPTPAYTLDLAMNLEASLDKEKNTVQTFLELLAVNQKIEMEGLLELDRNRGTLHIVGENLSLNRLSTLLLNKPELVLAGNADIAADADIALFPFALQQINAKLAGNPSILQSGGILPKNYDKKGHALLLTLNGTDRQWDFVLSGLSVPGPLPLSAGIAGVLLTKGNSLIGSGSIIARREPSSTGENKDTTPIETGFQFNISDTGEWLAEMKGLHSSDPGQSATMQVFNIKDAELRLNPSLFSFAAQGNTRTGEIGYEAAIPPLSMTTSTMKLTASQVRLNGLATKTAPQGNMEFRGNILVGTAEFTLIEQDIALLDISAEMPWVWPPAKEEKAGFLKAGQINLDTQTLGRLASTIRQQDLGLTIKGSMTSDLLQGLNLNFAGLAKLSQGGSPAIALDITLPAYTVAQTDLGRFHKTGSGLLLDGILAGKSSIAYSPAGLTASLQAALTDGNLAIADKKITIAGINTSLSFTDLLAMRSPPNQILSFSRASFGDILIEDGLINFQIESAQTFFIEKSDFKWCSGHVYSYALRITPEKNEYDVSLFADRLKLTALLEQFGGVTAEGDGTVSGRIPMLYRDGILLFGNGFLYSTPGDTGSIRLAGADILTAGIPENTPQYHQMDFATDALRNFRYNWVKLLMQSEGDEFIMQMQLDGKPAEPLPFAYNREIGSFVRVETKGQAGIMQPIKLDVNFRLPLDKILGYSGGINKFMDKLK